jgi:hypothetical protein
MGFPAVYATRRFISVFKKQSAAGSYPDPPETPKNPPALFQDMF